MTSLDMPLHDIMQHHTASYMITRHYTAWHHTKSLALPSHHIIASSLLSSISLNPPQTVRAFVDKKTTLYVYVQKARTFLLITVYSGDDFGMFVGLGLHLRLLRGLGLLLNRRGVHLSALGIHGCLRSKHIGLVLLAISSTATL